MSHDKRGPPVSGAPRPLSDGQDPTQDPRFQELLDAGEAEGLSPEEREELRQLWSALDEVEAADPETTLQPPRLIGEDMAATRRAQRRLPVALGILASFVIGSAFSMGMRADSGTPIIEIGAVAFMALGVLSLMAGMRLSRLKRAVGVGLVALGAVIYVIYTMMQLAATPTNTDIAWHQLGCLKAMMMWGVPGVILLVWSLWGARMPTPLTGGLLGIGVGFFSATFLHLHCPLISPMHLFLHHGGGIAMMGLIGSGAAWLLLRRSLQAAD